MLNLLKEHDIKPLEWPGDWPEIGCPINNPQGISSFFHNFFCHFFGCGYGKLEKLFNKELKSRNFSFKEIWSQYPDLLEIALGVQRILGEQWYQFMPLFIPQDSYLILGQMITGDLSEVEILLVMEDHFKVTFPEDSKFYEKTMLQFMEYLRDNRKPQQP